MIHAFTYRHLEIFLVLGFGAFCQFFASKKQRWIANATLGFLLLHSVVCVFRIDDSPIRRTLIHALVNQSHSVAWACKQTPRLEKSAELDASKAIVKELLGGLNCNTLEASSVGIGDHLAELVLFWR